MVQFSVMEQIRSGELLHKPTQKKKEEKKKLRKLKKEHNVSPRDINISSKFYMIYICCLFNMLATQNTDDTETEAENEDTA